MSTKKTEKKKKQSEEVVEVNVKAGKKGSKREKKEEKKLKKAEKKEKKTEKKKEASPKKESPKAQETTAHYLRIGDVVPDFTLDSTQGKIQFHKWKKGSWAFFFSHPADFTPICTTEMGQVAHLAPEWEKRNVKVIGLSVDSVEDHKKWIVDIEETQAGDKADFKVNFPILADPDRKVANLYGMLAPNAPLTLAGKLTVRSAFFIDPKNKLRFHCTYPAAVGRNFNELFRVIDAIQLSDKHQVATPANWKPGEDVVILPSVSNKQAEKKFKEFKTIKPYLRITAQPGVVESKKEGKKKEGKKKEAKKKGSKKEAKKKE